MHIVENILAKTPRIQLGRYLRQAGGPTNGVGTPARPTVVELPTPRGRPQAHRNPVMMRASRHTGSRSRLQIGIRRDIIWLKRSFGWLEKNERRPEETR